MLKRTQTKLNRSIRLCHTLIRLNMGTTILPKVSKKRKAPKEALVDFLINHARIEMALKLSISKDLGQRPKELTWLTLKDIDLSTGNVSITGAKHTIGREGQPKIKSLELLRILIKKKSLTANSHIYNGTSDNLGNNYRHYRNCIADEYEMPELKQYSSMILDASRHPKPIT
jgi:hypothetical protein